MIFLLLKYFCDCFNALKITKISLKPLGVGEIFGDSEYYFK